MKMLIEMVIEMHLSWTGLVSSRVLRVVTSYASQTLRLLSYLAHFFTTSSCVC